MLSIANPHERQQPFYVQRRYAEVPYVPSGSVFRVVLWYFARQAFLSRFPLLKKCIDWCAFERLQYALKSCMLDRGRREQAKSDILTSLAAHRDVIRKWGRSLTKCGSLLEPLGRAEHRRARRQHNINKLAASLKTSRTAPLPPRRLINHSRQCLEYRSTKSRR
jgi:hypothetical protein